MKSFIMPLILAVGLPMATLANGSSVRGGGDTCEAQIKEVRGEIKDWILKGGAKGLKLTPPLTHQQYDSKMLSAIEATSVYCVGEGDTGYPIEVDGTPKVCLFEKEGGSQKITCDYKKFLELNSQEQALLIHHEYAGLTDIEKPTGDSSLYNITMQIKSFNLAKTRYNNCKYALKEGILEITKSYNRLIYQCHSLEIQEGSSTRTYESFRRVARGYEEAYRSAQKLCRLSCDDTFFCEVDLSGACNR